MKSSRAKVVLHFIHWPGPLAGSRGLDALDHWRGGGPVGSPRGHHRKRTSLVPAASAVGSQVGAGPSKLAGRNASRTPAEFHGKAGPLGPTPAGFGPCYPKTAHTGEVKAWGLSGAGTAPGLDVHIRKMIGTGAEPGDDN